MKSVGMTQLRELIQGLAEGGKKQITNAMLYEALGLEEPDEKARLRRRVTDMVQRKELIRIKQGVFKYNPKAQPQRHGEMYIRIWRLVRSKQPGWSIQDLATITRASYTMVLKYCRFLLEEGYIAKFGKEGNTQKYRATGKAKDQRDTPYPPVAVKDPYEKERGASCRLVRQMMERDLSQPGVRKKIIKECRTILARFESEENI